MDFDRSKHNVIKYLPTNNDENIWGMSINGIGFQSIDPKGSYPLKGHPIGYTFNPDRGRIIDEFALVYIVKGEGTFTSINCFEKKISKGDAFFIFPGQWHSYQPIANIGWDEYYVTFQGDYFEKLLNGIINRANPIFHIGMNDQIVKHFGEIRVPGCFGGNYDAYDRLDLFDQQKSGLWTGFYAEDTGSMRIDAGKHLRQVYTGRYRRIHQHELFQFQEIIQAIHWDRSPSIHAATEAQQDQRFTEQYGNVDPRHRNEAQF